MPTTPPAAPLQLAAIERITDPIERIKASTEYLAQLAARQREAILVRDRTIVSVTDMGPAQLAKATGVSVSTIKAARRPR